MGLSKSLMTEAIPASLLAIRVFCHSAHFICLRLILYQSRRFSNTLITPNNPQHQKIRGRTLAIELILTRHQVLTQWIVSTTPLVDLTRVMSPCERRKRDLRGALPTPAGVG